MLMDGVTMDVGAVGDLRDCPHAAAAARAVLEHTNHSLLVGKQATAFAKGMGIALHSTVGPIARKMHASWLEKRCQPNYRRNVAPSAKTSCGPYKALNVTRYDEGAAANDLASLFTSWSPTVESIQAASRVVAVDNHDTIAMLVIDSDGLIAAGTSTNGARNKVPGRVGDR
jgi:isoaspartyl peptidase/L-asparaginase-like protein (Ntn-hydrolase superfamily)